MERILSKEKRDNRTSIWRCKRETWYEIYTIKRERESKYTSLTNFCVHEFKEISELEVAKHRQSQTKTHNN